MQMQYGNRIILDPKAAMRVAMADGQMTSDTVRKRSIVETAVWRKADLLSVGSKIIPQKSSAGLDIAATFPSNLIGSYPLAPGAKVNYEQVSYTPYGYTLYKFEARWLITGEAKLRGRAQDELRTTSRKAATALAFWKDKDILDKVVSGAYATNNVTVGGGDEWDSGSPTADPEADIVDAWNNLLSNGFEDEDGLKRISLVVPTNVYGQLMKLMLIGNVQQRLKEYLKGVYAIDILPTRYTDQITHPPGSIYTLAGATTGISDDAYMLAFSEDVGEHSILNTNIVPMSGRTLHDTGDEEYFVRQFFGSKIQPNSSTDATNVGIAKILNVT